MPESMWAEIPMLRRLVTASAEKCRCWKSDEVVSAAALLDSGERWWNRGFVWSLGSCRRRDAVAMVPIGANAAVDLMVP